jgi:hypothetical protein
MSVTEARRAVESLVRIQRLNYLDDLWTTGATSEPPADPGELAGIGREMTELLGRLRDDARWGLRTIDARREEFNQRANALVTTSPLSDAVKEELRERFGRRGWVQEAMNALEQLMRSEDVEAELKGQISELDGGLSIAGDLPPWFKCISLIAGSTMGILGLILAPPVGAAFALQLGSSALLAVPAIEECGGPPSLPSVSDDAAQVLEALIGETRAFGVGVPYYPFESVIARLGLEPAAVSRAIVELQIKGLVRIGSDVTVDRHGRRSTYPVYRVTKKGYRMPPHP